MLSNVLTFDKVYCASEFKCMNYKSLFPAVLMFSKFGDL